MSVRHSLLAILDQGPCYGYQLRAEFDRRTGSSWPLNVGQIYTTLDRLERDGLAVRHGTDEQGHVYYAITEAGRAEVRAWLGSPVERPAASRDDLAIKLALAVTLPGVDVAPLIEAQREVARRALGELRRSRESDRGAASSEELAELLIRDSAIIGSEAELRWLERAEARIARAAHAGRSAALPLSTEVPRRGRPARTTEAAAG